jgi:hypothetical protein
MAQFINEVKRFQKLAGIINENQENNEKAKQDYLHKLDTAVNSSKAIEAAKAIADKLSDKDKQKILAFTSGMSESTLNETDLEAITDKILSKTEKENKLEEKEISNFRYILGQLALGAPVVTAALGLQKAMELGGGPEALAKVGPTYFAAAAVGAVLILLGKVIKSALSRKKEQFPKSDKVSGFNIMPND